MVMDKKAVIHGVQQINSRRVEAVYWRPNRGSTGPNDEFVVIQKFGVTLLLSDRDGLLFWINARRETVR